MYPCADYNEQELRFAMGDPIVKCICELTGFKLTIEERVCNEEIFECDESGTRNVSGRSIEDYALWTYNFGYIKLFLLELKRDATIGMKSLCQAVGYHLASRKAGVTTEGDIIAPLTLVISQTKAYFLLYPYCINGKICGMLLYLVPMTWIRKFWAILLLLLCNTFSPFLHVSVSAQALFSYTQKNSTWSLYSLLQKIVGKML